MMASKQKSDVSIRKIILGCAVVLLACAASSWAAPAGSNARASQPGETKTGIPAGHSRVTSNDSIEMVNVPAGTFMMGARDDGDDDITHGSSEYAHERPRHEVTLSPYKIGKYEVTNGQMCAVLNWALGKGYLKNSTNGTFTGGNVYLHGQMLLPFVNYPENPITYTSGSRFSWKTIKGIGGNYSLENHPVSGIINWYGAVAFCNWLSEKEGLTPCYDLSSSNPTQWPLKFPYPNGYRLPTESEWERAAAWDGKKHWIYGYQSDTRLEAYKRCNCDYIYPDGVSRIVDPLGFTTYPFTSPVGWFNGINVSPNGNVQTIDSPSPVGCYDMSGNAEEWCEDRWHSDYTDVPTDGTALETQLVPYSASRVQRGEGYSGIGRTAHRTASAPYAWGTAQGFRVARTWEPTDESVTNVSRPSYIVVKGELKPNKLVYIDSTYLYQNPIPPALYKQSHIRTAQADKDATAPASFLSFDVNREVIIYVAIDARIATPPAWLSSWAFRIDQLVTDDPAEPNRKLYSKRFPKGHITLGPNRDPSMPQGKSMYTVVIIPVVTGVKDWSLYSQAK